MRLTITRKIALPFVLILLLMAVMAIVSFIGQSLNSQNIESMRNHTAKQAVAVDLQIDFAALLMSVNDYIITGKQGYREEYFKQKDTVRKHLRELRAVSLTDHERAHLDTVENNIRGVEAYADSILNIRVVPTEGHLASLMETMDYQYGQRVSSQLTGLYETIGEIVQAQAGEMVILDRRGFLYTLIAFLIAFPIAVIVVWLTMNRISRPLLRLVHMAERITMRDFSARLKAETEDEIGVLVEAFNAMAEEIRRRYDELESFAYIVAHDLKNPITGIRGMTEMTLTDAGNTLDAESKENLSIVIQASNSMMALINDLLDFARAGKIEFAREPVPMNEILDDVQRDMLFFIRERKAEIVVPQDLPAIRCDPIRFSQIWKNLLSNAIKYNENPAPRVEITCDSSQPRFHTFDVKDNGIGLDEKDYETIFHPFKRAHTKDRYEGTGIGLAIVKRVVDFHGGRIWVTSRRGEGTTFHFTLPKISDLRKE